VCSLVSVLAASVLSLLAGCGEDLSDTEFGGLDMTVYYGDADVPLNIRPFEAWYKGRKAIYYNLHKAAAVLGTPSPEQQVQFGLTEEDLFPRVSPVNPMYFFFDAKGNPLFSVPVKEKKTSTFLMRGGFDVLNPNPADDAVKNVAYPTRKRDLLKDPKRNNVANYQRPIVDIFDSELNKYSGLWEFVKIEVPNGYEIESIKSWRTLEKAWKGGDVKLTRTSFVINCPIVDDRTYITPAVSVYRAEDLRVPQPKMEIWYRSKRGSCLLVNGWETLGETTGDPDRKGDDRYRLFAANEDDRRVQTFDAESYKLGSGEAERIEVVAPLGLVYIPQQQLGDGRMLWSDALTAQYEVPRRKKSDPPGFRPVAWLWGINVNQAGRTYNGNDFTDQTFTDIRNVDGSLLRPLDSNVANIPLVGLRINCQDAVEGEEDPCGKIGLVCPKFQDSVEPYCEERKSGYGDYCAPTIAKCRDKNIGGATQSKQDPMEQAFYIQNRPKFGDITISNLRTINYRDTEIYSCHGEVEGTGHCYFSCKGGEANYLQGQKIVQEVDVGGGRTLMVDLLLDSRCGGTLMPGFRCLPINNQAYDTGGRYCMRDCDGTLAASTSSAICQIPTPISPESAKENLDIAKGTRCLTINSVTGCAKDLSLEPQE
jgi:hypothetical protein